MHLLSVFMVQLETFQKYTTYDFLLLLTFWLQIVLHYVDI